LLGFFLFDLAALDFFDDFFFAACLPDLCAWWWEVALLAAGPGPVCGLAVGAVCGFSGAAGAAGAACARTSMAAIGAPSNATTANAETSNFMAQAPRSE
jgi:hypothetical protein